MSSDIRNPYLMFLGDAPDQLAAKTAAGVAHWRPEWCIGQLRLEGCKADLGLPDMSLEAGRDAGCKTLIIGVANRGGRFSPAWGEVFQQALELGYDIASGLHKRLDSIQGLAEKARQEGRRLIDVRHPKQEVEVANGVKRSGKRLLPVGTDCSVGKMYATLALEQEMRSRGMKCTFRAAGQTGIFIAGSGVSIDAVVADFISGAVEWLTPDNEPDHWDLVEGQGSLFHASFAGVTTGLIHGAQPDALVLCHEPTRRHMRGLPNYPLPDLALCMERNLQTAELTNPECRFIGLSVNSQALESGAARKLLRDLEWQFKLPAVGPLREGVGALVDALV